MHQILSEMSSSEAFIEKILAMTTNIFNKRINFELQSTFYEN